MLSIIVPFFNNQNTIGKLLDSINRQECNEQLEIIAVSDGSQDQSREIVQRFQQKGLNINIIEKENGGQATARNIGLQSTHGDFVMFMDADDELPPNALTQLMEGATDNDLVVGAVQKTFSDHTQIQESTLTKNNNQEELISRYLTHGNEADVGLWNKVFKRPIIEQNNIKFEETDYFEDSMFVLDYLSVMDPMKIKRLDQVVYILNKIGTSTTRHWDNQLEDKIQFYYDRVAAHVVNKKTLNGLRLRLDVFYVNQSAKNHGDPQRKTIKAFLRRHPVSLGAVMEVPRQYAVAWILLKFNLGLYIKMYKAKNI